ncbi:hypothetical protein AVEN_206346-1 [Araneus ventricosus]|uniref:Uncharacterized protein n=1 Tax=Araneus ventricosus TaxID=182803 RepID=A0A4Y2JGI4_ARAVE|nr:hypothetical protein AVEN_206346-1 [Araneus ventricosus]
MPILYAFSIFLLRWKTVALMLPLPLPSEEGLNNVKPDLLKLRSWLGHVERGSQGYKDSKLYAANENSAILMQHCDNMLFFNVKTRMQSSDCDFVSDIDRE